MRYDAWGYILLLLLWLFGTANSMYFVRTSKKVVQYLQDGNLVWLKEVWIIGAVFVTSLFLYRYATRYTWPKTWQTVYSQLKKDYLEKFVRLDNNSAERIWTGKMVGIISVGIENRVAILNMVWFAARNLVTATTSFVVLRTQSTYVFYYALCILLISAWIAIYKEPYVTKIRTALSETSSEHTRHLVRVLMSKFEILSAWKFDKETKKINALRDERIALRKKEYTAYFSVLDLPGSLIDCVKFIIPLLAAGVFGHVTFSLSDLASMFLLINFIDNAIGNMISMYHQVAVRVQDVTKLRDTFDSMPLIQGYEDGEKFVYKSGMIELNDVTFAYGEKDKEERMQDVLQHFSLEIAGGEKTALVGSSGSGKSTIIKLIAWYLHVTWGRILVDGQELQNWRTHNNKAQVSLDSYYKHIGYLTQEPNVFDGTIWENITYSIDEATLDHEELTQRVSEALRLSKCDFVDGLPQWLNTEIGEKWIRLSGGQRQRLAIAKIFLKNPEIILLDEPTSALDSFAEQEITEAMENLFKGRTVIVIAHRLQTVKAADDIVVLEQGKIIERWTHEELVAKWWTYAKMLELQSGF